jgi:hypothetical protein
MKRLSVLILIVAFAVVGWVLPAGAEKIRLTDDQMDNVAAGSQRGNCATCLVDEQFGGGSFFGGGGFSVKAVCEDGVAVKLKGGGHLNFGNDQITTQSNGGGLGLGGGGFLKVDPGANKIVQYGGGFQFGGMLPGLH